jgi:hypothetical protein
VERWSLAALGVSEGDVLVLQACAVDNDPLDPGVSWSKPWEVRVIRRTEFDQMLAPQLAVIERKLIDLSREQQSLARLVDELAQNLQPLRGSAPRIRQKFVDTELKQRQLVQAIDDQRTGLWMEIELVLHFLEANQVDQSILQQRLQGYQHELGLLRDRTLRSVGALLQEAQRFLHTGTSVPELQTNLTRTSLELRRSGALVERFARILQHGREFDQPRLELQALLDRQGQLQDQVRQWHDAYRGQLVAELPDSAREAQARLVRRQQQLLLQFQALMADWQLQTTRTREPSVRPIEDAVRMVLEGDLSGTMDAIVHELEANQTEKALRSLSQLLRNLENVTGILQRESQHEHRRFLTQEQESSAYLERLLSTSKELVERLETLSRRTDPPLQRSDWHSLSILGQNLHGELELQGIRFQELGQCESAYFLQRFSQHLDEMIARLDRLVHGEEPTRETLAELIRISNALTTELESARLVFLDRQRHRQCGQTRAQLDEFLQQLRGLSERQRHHREEWDAWWAYMQSRQRWTRRAVTWLESLTREQAAQREEAHHLAEATRAAPPLSAAFRNIEANLESRSQTLGAIIREAHERLGAPARLSGTDLFSNPQVTADELRRIQVVLEELHRQVLEEQYLTSWRTPSAARSRDDGSLTSPHSRRSEPSSDLEIWLRLPPQLRPSLEQFAVDQFAPKYREQLLEYYRSLDDSRRRPNR